MPEHRVVQGDCIMSISETRGLPWETIWNDEQNAALRQSRKDPNILFPGDVVFVPERALGIADAPTDQRTTFVKKTARVQVKLRLLDYGRRPRANVEYIATVDGAASTGRTDGDGCITLSVRGNAQRLQLRVCEGSKTDEYALPLGAIDPIGELSGVQQRLANLGYSCGSEQGTLGDATRTAVRAFQKERQLPLTGELDDATRASLQQLHGS